MSEDRKPPGVTVGNTEKKVDYARKYYKKRYSLFSKFDKGVKISQSMWFSITPERVSLKIAERAQVLFPSVSTIVDCCGGAGGNVIAFARHNYSVIYVDRDQDVMFDAVHNSHIYGIFNIDFYCGDALDFTIGEVVQDDPAHVAIFASPEWGGPSYATQAVFDVFDTSPDIARLIHWYAAQKINKFCFFLPRTSNLNQLAELGATHIDYYYEKGYCRGLCAWFGVEIEGSLDEDPAADG